MAAKLFVFAALAISEVFSACGPTETKFENFQRTPRRSIRFKIGVITTKCRGLSEFYYEWKVQEIPGYKVVNKSSESTLDVDGYNFPTSKVFIVEYLVTVSISHYPNMSHSDSVQGVFHFIPDRMHIEIKGGFEKTHPYGEDLVIDAKTLSTDLSFPKKENAFAGNAVYWMVQPIIREFDIPDKLIVTVPSKFLKSGYFYTFTVTVKRTKIPRYITIEEEVQVVEIMIGTFPLLNIFCIRNCFYPHNLEVTVFGINCTKNCHGLKYEWFTFPKPSDHTKIDFGVAHDKLVILNGAFKAGEKVSVVVRTNGTHYSRRFEYVSGLIKGECHLDPQEGISSVTKFKVNCTEFGSRYGVVIYNIYQKTTTTDVLINTDTYSTENEVYLTAKRPNVLEIQVQDYAFATINTTVKVTVDEFQPEEDIETKSAVKKLILNAENTSIISYSFEGYNNEAIQLISSLLDTMEVLGMDEGIKRDLHKHMAEAVLRLKPVWYPNVMQLILILHKIESHRIKDDIKTLELIGKGMAYSGFHLHLMRNHAQGPNIPQTLIEDFIRLSTFLAMEIIRERQKIVDILNAPTPIHDYDSYDDYVSRKVDIRTSFQKLMANVLLSIQTNCITVLHQTLPNEKAKYFENELIVIQTERILLAKFKLIYYTVAGGYPSETKVYLSNKFLRELETINSYVDLQIVVFRKNPFWWHPNVTAFQTEIVIFDLFIKCDRVKPFKNPFYISFKISSIPMEVKHGNLTDKRIVAHKIQLESHRTLIIHFNNIPKEHTSYMVTWADCICKEDDFNSPRTRVIEETSTTTEKSYKISHEDGTLKTIFICIKKLTPIVSYEMSFTTFACLYWNITNTEWRTDGCRVKRFNEIAKDLVCECYHLSLFAGQVSVPPNTLNKYEDIDFTIDFVKNYTMIYAVSTFIFLWIISLILAHLKDKSMKRKNIVHKLDDNVPGDPYGYLVVVFTGAYFDAPTTADVGFQLVGEEAKSRVHLIRCEGFKLLQRNTQAWFTIYSPFYLGELKKIRMWHNSKGKRPHWYCERVIVQDLETGTQYCFPVEKWFSVTWGAKKTFRVIPLDPPPEKIPKLSFLAHLERDMRDNHVWISVLVRDFQSNFNSKERVSAAFCFIFSSISVNVLLTDLPRNIPLHAIDKKNELFGDFSRIFISLEAWLTASVLAYFIVFVFKNSKPL